MRSSTPWALTSYILNTIFYTYVEDNPTKNSLQSSPWYAGVSQELRSAKRQRRRAERRWLKTGLTVDKQIYGAAKRANS